MSAAFIDQQRIRDVAQVLELTPGATFTSLHKGQQDFSLRGISSQTEGAAGDSAVSTYVDNIVIGKDFAKSVEFFDVDRVEILRGPQGTTFGRNTSAGLVHIINKRPSRDFSAYVEGTVGDYNLYEVTGIVNGRDQRRCQRPVRRALRRSRWGTPPTSPTGAISIGSRTLLSAVNCSSSRPTP